MRWFVFFSGEWLVVIVNHTWFHPGCHNNLIKNLKPRSGKIDPEA